jgi:ferrous iron transport protein A
MVELVYNIILKMNFIYNKGCDEMVYLTLNQLNDDSKAVVMNINGGSNLVKKLNALGIREGVVLTKESQSFLRGPVTVKIGQSKIAVGYGMAEKILVKLVDDR